jgi:hypothetical protein
LGATTPLYHYDKIIMTGTFSSFTTIDDSMQKDESNVMDFLISQLRPKDNHVVIKGSDNEELQRAEIGAKNAALFTIMNHEKHTH